MKIMKFEIKEGNVCPRTPLCRLLKFYLPIFPTYKAIFCPGFFWNSNNDLPTKTIPAELLGITEGFVSTTVISKNILVFIPRFHLILPLLKEMLLVSLENMIQINHKNCCRQGCRAR